MAFRKNGTPFDRYSGRLPGSSKFAPRIKVLEFEANQAGATGGGRRISPFVYRETFHAFKNPSRRGPSSRSRFILKYDLKGDYLRKAKQAAEAFKLLGGHGSVIEQVNKESLEWVKDRAVDNLNKKIRQNRRPQIRSRTTKSLQEVIKSDLSHILTPYGFEFMRKDLVYKQIDYAFSLEYGDDSQVGRFIPFAFLGRSPVVNGRGRGRATHTSDINERDDKAGKLRFNHPARVQRSNHPGGVEQFGASKVTDRLIGPREFHTTLGGDSKLVKARYKVEIKRPVPEYRYGRDARESFVSEGIYMSKLESKFASLGKATGTKVRKGRSAKGKASKAASS